MKWTLEIGSDFVVVGHNPEAADMSNPRGEIIRERFYVGATTEYGRRRFWRHGFETEEAALEAYLYLATPVAFWEESTPVYGSEAYAANWGEYEADKIAWEKDQEESAWFARFR